TKRAADRYGDRVAARYKRGDEWDEITYAELWERVRAVALGLVDLGVEIGDRVCILVNTRLEFTVVDLAAATAGAIVVPVYPTNSADECEWVVGNSGATLIFCENESQVAKIDEVRSQLPELRHVVVIDGHPEGTMTLDEVAARGSGGDASELDRRAAAVNPDDACLIIYTSGTTGRPKGVVLTNKGFAFGRRSAVDVEIFGEGDVVYLFPPLAHVFAQLIQADCIEVGATIAFWGGDATQIVPELGIVKPTVLPSVPRIFEKVYALAMGMVPPGDEDKVAQAVQLGLSVRRARRAGQDVPEEQAAAFEKIDGEMFALIRGIFGGNVQLAISGAAPIASEILEFFYAAGVPVFEGWGMTETTSLGTLNLPDAFRFGTIGRPIEGVDVRIAEDGEIEIAGGIVMREYWRNPEATADTMTEDGYLRTGDLGSIDDEGFVSITGRKKDIIITAGGKNLTPANLEGDLRRSRWISQAVMFGDRKPYPVAVITLDPEEIGPWAQSKGLPTDIAELSETTELNELIQGELDAVNSQYAKVEQIKRFKVLDHDFSVETGELTPSLKLKRNVVYDRFSQAFEDLYA
ncbi:MAG: AMP-dependent synthetase/ligase, partial [Ilumatobacteraceae bacterium]